MANEGIHPFDCGALDVPVLQGKMFDNKHNST